MPRTALIKIIQPGWGSSGYYSQECLERAARDNVFKRGTKMFLDHPTEAEEQARPERSVRDLAGELLEDAHFRVNAPQGPGLYARAVVFKPFAEVFSEVHPHIGVSIRASGKVTNGEVDGKKGRLIEEITAARSIDYVTFPGAGGKVANLIESVRSAQQTKEKKMARKIEETRDLNEVQAEVEAQVDALLEENEALQARVDELEEALEEAEGELQKLRAEKAVAEATSVIEKALAETKGLPEATKKRIREAALLELELEDNTPLTERIVNIIKAEADYIAAVGVPQNPVKDMGETTPTLDATKIKESLEKSFRDLGLTESAAKIAAAGR